MKQFTMMILVAGLAVTASAQNIARREVRQQQRIGQGVRSGELTGPETRALERREAALRRQIARNRVDGPGLTGVERARIERRQDRMSNQIYRRLRWQPKRPPRWRSGHPLPLL